MDDQAVATAIQLAVNILTVELSFDRDWHVDGNVAVPGMEVKIGGEVGRKFQAHAAVGSANVPRPGDPRAGTRHERDSSVAGRDVECIEAAGNADGTVTGPSSEVTVNVLDFDPAVARVDPSRL